MGNNVSAVTRLIQLSGSRKELAKRIGVTRQAVDLWAKKGVPPLSRVPQIAAAFGVKKGEVHPFYKD